MDPIDFLSNHLTVTHAVGALTLAFFGAWAWMYVKYSRATKEFSGLMVDVGALLAVDL